MEAWCSWCLSVSKIAKEVSHGFPVLRRRMMMCVAGDIRSVGSRSRLASGTSHCLSTWPLPFTFSFSFQPAFGGGVSRDRSTRDHVKSLKSLFNKRSLEGLGRTVCFTALTSTPLPGDTLMKTVVSSLDPTNARSASIAATTTSLKGVRAWRSNSQDGPYLCFDCTALGLV